MRKMGFKIQYVADAVVEHSHNYTIKEVRKRFYNEGFADGLIYGESANAFSSFVKPVVMEILRDLAYLLKNGQILSIPYGIVYRINQKYSYYKGRKDYDRRNRKQT